MRGQNDNTDLAGGRIYAPSTAILLLPGLAIAVLYGAILAGLMLNGQGDSALATLCVVALALTPFLFAHAILRRITTRLVILPHGIHLQPGFPRSLPVEVPYGLVRSIKVKRGLGGRLAGSGTLTIGLANGRSVAVSDLAHPERAAEAIGEQMEARRTLQTTAETAETPAFRRFSAR